MYSKVIRILSKGYSRILSKGYSPIPLLPPSKLERILDEVRMALSKTNKEYDLVLTHFYLYYDMKLVTFGIDEKQNSDFAIPSICTAIYTQKVSNVSD